MSLFSERFKQLKEETPKMTLKELSQKLDITVPNLSYYMNGREPNYDTLIKIANYYDVTVDWLIGRTDAKNPSSADTLATIELRVSQNNDLKLSSDEASKYYLSIQDTVLDVLCYVYILVFRFYNDYNKEFDLFLKQFRTLFNVFLFEIESYVSASTTKNSILKFLQDTNIISEALNVILFKCSYTYAKALATHSKVLSSEDLNLINGIINFLNQQLQEKYPDQKIKDLFSKMSSM